MQDENSNSILIETSGGNVNTRLSVYHRKERNVFISGEIDQEMADNFLMTMLYYEQNPDLKPINIYINSPGGQVQSGLMMVDVLRHTSLETNLICTGLAASMAAVLLAAGKKGHRYAYPHSKIMIHEPLISNGIGGSTSSIRELSESMLQTKKTLNEILSESTGKTLDEIDKATSFDHYFNVNEAIEFGLCDSVLNRIAA